MEFRRVLFRSHMELIVDVGREPNNFVTPAEFASEVVRFEAISDEVVVQDDEGLLHHDRAAALQQGIECRVSRTDTKASPIDGLKVFASRQLLDDFLQAAESR